VTAKFRERLHVTKQEAQKSYEETLNLKKLSVLHVRKQYQIIISKSLAALENLNNSEDTNRAWEKIEENIKEVEVRVK